MPELERLINIRVMAHFDYMYPRISSVKKQKDFLRAAQDYWGGKETHGRLDEGYLLFEDMVDEVYMKTIRRFGGFGGDIHSLYDT